MDVLQRTDMADIPTLTGEQTIITEDVAMLIPEITEAPVPPIREITRRPAATTHTTEETVQRHTATTIPHVPPSIIAETVPSEETVEAIPVAEDLIPVAEMPVADNS